VVTLLLTLSDNAHSIPFQQLRWTWIHVLSVVLFVSQLLWVLIVQSSSHYGESVYSMVVWFCHIFFWSGYVRIHSAHINDKT
jgi:hypothetical protein